MLADVKVRQQGFANGWAVWKICEKAAQVSCFFEYPQYAQRANPIVPFCDISKNQWSPADPLRPQTDPAPLPSQLQNLHEHLPVR